MPRRHLTLPPAEWPVAVAERFAALLPDPCSHQTARLRGGLGRWLKLAAAEGADPAVIDGEIWLRRTHGLSPAVRRAMRQSIALVWPDMLRVTQTLDRPDRPTPDRRARRAREIERLLARLPANWRAAAAPLVAVGPTALEDGPLHDAWRPSTIVRRLEAAARHLEFCREAGLPLDVTPGSLRAALATMEAREKVPRPGAIAVEVNSLLGAVRAIRPSRNWSWLVAAERAISKRARAFGSRNEARVVDVTDLRRAGLSLLAAARIRHEAAVGLRDRSRAHDRARAGLLMLMLSESPLRIGSVSSLDLVTSLAADLRRLSVAAEHTKEKMEDRRTLSRDLVAGLGQYIALHRPVLAREAEAALFVDRFGKRASPEALSTAFTKSTRTEFGRPVNPHAVRTSVATRIVATAPEEAALAGLILPHRDPRTTTAYHASAGQFAASRALNAATEAAMRDLSIAAPKSASAVRVPPPTRSLRLDLARRRQVTT